jgi:hypothetical protein
MGDNNFLHPNPIMGDVAMDTESDGETRQKVGWISESMRKIAHMRRISSSRESRNRQESDSIGIPMSQRWYLREGPEWMKCFIIESTCPIRVQQGEMFTNLVVVESIGLDYYPSLRWLAAGSTVAS